MNWKVNKESLLWVIGAIAIGIASNAIWDFLVKPILRLTQNSVLTFTTFGIQQFKNAIYIEIAKGNQDRASDFVLALVIVLFAILIFSYNVFLLNSLKEIKERIRGLSSEINAIEADMTNVDPPPI